MRVIAAVALAAAVSVPASGATSGKTYAQKLVDEAVARHPELIVLAMHVTPPGQSDNVIIASNIGRIGKKADEDDLRVIQTGKPNLEVNKTGDRFEVELVLQDVSGKTVGALGTVFAYKAGDDQAALQKKAEKIRDELRQQIPSVAKLVERVEDKPVLVPAATIKIPDSKGKFDFIEVDPARHRLLASHEGDGTADILDLGTNRLITRVKVGGAPVDMATDPKTGKYFVSAQEGKRVAVVDGSTFKETNSIPMDGPLDAILFDPKNRRVYVAHDDGSHLWVIDADSEKVVGSVTIPGAPEYMVYDAAGDRIYLNIKTTNEVVVVDPHTNTIVAHWPTAPATRPHGLALDAASGRLFSAGDNGKLALLDIKTGKVVAVADITNKVDQIAFDPSTRRVYCTGPDWMSVVQETPDGAVFLANVKTAPTAKNVVVDPRTHAVWTTYSDGANSWARSWVAP